MMRMFPNPGESQQDFYRDWLRYLADSIEQGDAWVSKLDALVDEHADPPTVTFTLRVEAPHLKVHTQPEGEKQPQMAGDDATLIRKDLPPIPVKHWRMF